MKSILKKLVNTCSILAVFVLLDACYPQGAEFVDELDLVMTVYDEDYDFGSRKTYAINDEIPLIGTEEPMDEEQAEFILDEINTQMANRDYDLVAQDAVPAPDIVILVGALKVKTTVVGCGGGGWWGYYPGWGYPGGCWYPVGYSYSTGSIFITLWDKDSVPVGDNDSTPPEWEVGINGVLQGSQSSINARIEKAIGQAFEQSPYIQSDI